MTKFVLISAMHDYRAVRYMFISPCGFNTFISDYLFNYRLIKPFVSQAVCDMAEEPLCGTNFGNKKLLLLSSLFNTNM